MKNRVVVVGSGASAVHFSLSALQRGHDILMLDVGREPPSPTLPGASLKQMKDQLEDPVEYFLGQRFESVLYPGAGAEYYGFPPSKNYVFSGLSRFQWRANGFKPLASFAQGGLAEAWTGGVYPFNAAELASFPFDYQEIGPYYDLVASRVGISGAVDDLARFMPVHQDLMPPLDLDGHSAVLLDAYARRRARVNGRECYMGRSRIATISRDHNGRKACDYRGRCLWGCPSQSLYTPRLTLEQCRQFPGFQHVTGVYARHFNVEGGRRIRSVVVETIGTGAIQEIPVETLVLGAGTLSSCRIFLESVYRSTGELVTLTGLMDNPQVLMPFVNLSMLRQPFNPDSYQYHQLGIGLESPVPHEYIHGQITTLKTALIHPIVQNMPFDLKTSLAIFRNMHAALGLVNINLHDTRRQQNSVSIEPGHTGAPATLLIHYDVGPTEAARVKAAMTRVRKVLWDLNCVVPPGMSHVRPMGASVHYAGLLPMSKRPAPWTTSEHCRSHDFENLYFVDATTFPFLPAKNLTFTLMANAARVAERAF